MDYSLAPPLTSLHARRAKCAAHASTKPDQKFRIAGILFRNGKSYSRLDQDANHRTGQFFLHRLPYRTCKGCSSAPSEKTGSPPKLISRNCSQLSKASWESSIGESA